MEKSTNNVVVNKLANILSIETGDMLLLTNSKNACFIKTNKIIIAEFKNITWDLAKLEGENKSLNEWKETYMNYFNKIDPNFNENTKVIFEVYEVIKKCK